MAKEDLEIVAMALMAVTAPFPGNKFDDFPISVLGEDADFHGLPTDDEADVSDMITQEIVLKLAAAAIRAIRLPTKRMKAAGAARLVAEGAEPGDDDLKKAGEVFRAMIEEVLRQ